MHNQWKNSKEGYDMNQTNGKGQSWFISFFNAAKEKMNQISAYQLNSYLYGHVQMPIFIYRTCQRETAINDKCLLTFHIHYVLIKTFYQLDWPVDQLP